MAGDNDDTMFGLANRDLHERFAPKHDKCTGQKWCAREIGTSLRYKRKRSLPDDSYQIRTAKPVKA